MIELTEQQSQTLNLFVEGMSMKEIALHLGVSYSRVINILNSILIKTGSKSRKELLSKARLLEISVTK